MESTATVVIDGEPQTLPTEPVETSEPMAMDLIAGEPQSLPMEPVEAMESMETDVTAGEPEKLPTEPPRQARKPVIEMTVEEMVEQAIVPIKKEFLCLAPKRLDSDGNGLSSDAVAASTTASAPVIKEKIPRRQFKRERQQEKKSTRYLCSEVTKTGKLDSCTYGDKCCFNHDIEAFLAQKPADLEGKCPFDSDENACPYGLGCRYLGTHRSEYVVSTANIHKNSEVNALKKEVQMLLRKNKMKFPKADAKLKALGLLGPAKWNGKPDADNKEESQTVSNVANENGNNDPCDSVEETNGGCLKEKDVDTQLESVSTAENIETDKSLKLHTRERKLIDFRDKLYLAPLTTVGNLPFRRVCKGLGADITCGEMAMCTNLLQGHPAEWALLRRHESENVFGVQICGAHPDTVTRAVELIEEECSVDFIDINMGCPIDLVVNKGGGSALLAKPSRMKNIIRAVSSLVNIPITIKARISYYEGRSKIGSVIGDVWEWGATAVTIHGRTRQQRYTKLPNWEYVYECTKKAPETLQVIGNGDIFSFSDWRKHKTECPQLSSCMIARGGLVKPWLFTEIKEQRDWDISSGERLNIFKDFVGFGLQHWGSDTKGVETTRSFLLEWLSYTYRYVPVGLLEVLPQRLNSRPPTYFGRDDLETLMASESAADWIKISEMLLGKVPDGFRFTPKHKSNAFDKAENG